MTDLLDKLAILGSEINKDEFDRLEAVLEQSKTTDEIDQLILNHSIPQSEAAKICGVSLNTFKDKVKEALAEGVIPEVVYTSGRYLYTLKHMHALMDWMKIPKWSDSHTGCPVADVQNQKGGTGKSTTLFSVATSIALDLKQRKRVLVVDLDPQGSLRNFAAADHGNTAQMLTSVDLMLGELEPESYYASLADLGYEHSDLVQSSVIGTHIPNLDIIPSFPSDERFSAAAWEEYAKTGDMNDFLKLLDTKVLSLLKPHYDLIFVVTGPHTNPLVWNAMEASDAVIVPVSPRKLDWKSTCQFIEELPNHFYRLPSQGKNIQMLKIMVVNYDDEQSRDLDMLNQIKEKSGKWLLNCVIKRSSAFEIASRNYRTVFDLKKSDSANLHCPPRQLSKAVDSLRDATRELQLNLAEVEGR